MVKLALSLIFAFLLSAGAQAQTGASPIACNQVFQVSQAAVALTKIVSGTATQQITLCGWAINGGAATGTAQLKSGTGTNCGTSTATLTPPISMPINGTYVDHNVFAFQSLNQAVDLCLVTTGTGPTQITVYYGLF